MTMPAEDSQRAVLERKLAAIGTALSRAMREWKSLPRQYQEPAGAGATATTRRIACRLADVDAAARRSA